MRQSVRALHRLSLFLLNLEGAMNKRIRYTRQNVVTNTFYQMPKFLFDCEFSNMSNDARVLYMLLRHRHELSIKNNWFDENGAVFLHYKREDMQSMLNLSKNTISKLMKELRNLQLIEEERQGLNKPNRIYLLVPEYTFDTLHEIDESTKSGEDNANHDDERNLNKWESGSSNTGKQEGQFVTPKYNNINYTNNKNESVLSSQVSPNQNRPDTDETDIEVQIENYKKIIKSNIGYSDFQEPGFFDIELVDSFVDIIIDTIYTKCETVRIGKEDKPLGVVKSVFIKLNHQDIEHAISQFKGVTERIINKKSYIRTLLYNCKLEGEAHYTNEYVSNRWG